MPSQPPPAASNNGNKATLTKVILPPEEQFWQRYSPHHEAPLSGLGSFALHFLIGGFLVIAGALGLFALGSHRGPLTNDVVSFEQSGGGGSRRGSGDEPGGPPKQEAAEESKTEQSQTPPETSVPPSPDLKDPAVTQNLPPEAPAEDQVQRFIKEGTRTSDAINGLSQSFQARVREGLRQPGAGKGGTGQGGGKGTGTGQGEGPGRGDGKGTISQRERRMLRWTMQFDTRSGHDYLRQLRELGAILAIPKDRAGNDYWIIRDLGSRPPKLLDEDVSQIQRIFWVDDKPNSVSSIMRALGLNETPDKFVAFMPQELEEELFKKELDYRGLREDDIDETIFQVRVIGGKYTPVVVTQRQKR